jgi:hypothetical protein
MLLLAVSAALLPTFELGVVRARRARGAAADGDATAGLAVRNGGHRQPAVGQQSDAGGRQIRAAGHGKIGGDGAARIRSRPPMLTTPPETPVVLAVTVLSPDGAPLSGLRSAHALEAVVRVQAAEDVQHQIVGSATADRGQIDAFDGERVMSARQPADRRRDSRTVRRRCQLERRVDAGDLDHVHHEVDTSLRPGWRSARRSPHAANGKRRAPRSSRCIRDPARSVPATHRRRIGIPVVVMEEAGGVLLRKWRGG